MEVGKKTEVLLVHTDRILNAIFRALGPPCTRTTHVAIRDFPPFFSDGLFVTEHFSDSAE